jgi:plastocyanin
MKHIRLIVLLIALMSFASCAQKETSIAMPTIDNVDVAAEETMVEEILPEDENTEPSETPDMMKGETSMEEDMTSMDETSPETEASVKEFEMTSFVEMIDGKPYPQFSLKEMEVNEGDTVRISITNTAGTHDFTLDEFGISVETPLEETVVVEFVAGAAGSYEYYCSKPDHRGNGHWGTLIVQ